MVPSPPPLDSPVSRTDVHLYRQDEKIAKEEVKKGHVETEEEAKARNSDASLGDGVVNGDGHTKEGKGASPESSVSRDGTADSDSMEKTKEKEVEADGGFKEVS